MLPQERKVVVVVGVRRYAKLDPDHRDLVTSDERVTFPGSTGQAEFDAAVEFG